MKKTGRHIILSIIKGAVLLLLTASASALWKILFVGGMLGEEIISERALNIWHMVFFLLIFYSITVAVDRYDVASRERFLERLENNRPVSHVKLAVFTVEFYIQLACVTVLSIILPVDLLYGFVGNSFFYEVDITDFNDKLYTLLTILPIMTLILFAAKITVQKKWYMDSKKSGSNSVNKTKSKMPPTAKNVISVIVIYCAVAFALPWFFPFFITLWELGGVMLFVWIAVVFLSLALITVAAYYFRALFKRISFVRKIKKYCSFNSLSISGIKRPYASVFVSQSGFDFSVEKNGIKYDCKFIAGIFPWAQIVFSDKGNGIIQNTVRLFRIEVFHFVTKFEFGFEGGGKKILILLPTPKKFFVSENQSSPRPGDVGEKVGEYTIYNSTGFLNALNRDCI